MAQTPSETVATNCSTQCKLGDIFPVKSGILSSSMIAENKSFDIRSHIDKLNILKEESTQWVCECPVCGKHRLTIKKETGEYSCWSGGCPCPDIREAIAPWEEYKSKHSGTGNFSKPKGKRTQNPLSPLSKLPLAPSTGEYHLARIPTPVSVPKSHKDFDNRHGEVLKTKYVYSLTPEGELQRWVIRTDWADPEKPKGRSKSFAQWHRDSSGKSIPKKGDVPWEPYRIDEAIAAVKAAQAPGKTVALLFGEGEGVVESLRKAELAAITQPGSSWGKQEMEALVQRLKDECPGAILVILPDNDAVGKKKAEGVQAACDRKGVFSVIIDLLSIDPSLDEGGDVADILAKMEASEFIRRLEEEIHKAVELRRSQQIRDASSKSDATVTEEQCLQSLPGADGDASDASDGSGKSIKTEEKSKPPVLPSQSVMARELADRTPHLCFVDEQSHWRFYKDGWWQSASQEHVYSLVTNAIEAAGIDEFVAAYPSGVTKLLMSKRIVERWPERRQNLLPFKNGVLDLTTRKLLPHSPDYGFTSIIDRDHDESATDWTPIQDWLNFALDGNADQINLLLCWYAAVLRSLSKLHRFLLLVGRGGTGKSTAMQLAQALIGRKSSHSLTLESLHTNSFQTGNIFDKLLVCINDADMYRGNLNIFKNITGGDGISCEAKFERAFTAIYQGMVMLTANNPVFINDDSGLERRMILIRLNRVAPKVNINFMETLVPHLSAFTNYLLSIPLDTVVQTLISKEDRSGERLRVEIDNLIATNATAAWLNNNCVFSSESFERLGNDRSKVDQLFGNYYQYTLASGGSPRGDRNFKDELLRLGNGALQDEKKKCGVVVQGIRLDESGGFIEQIKSQNFKSPETASLPSLPSQPLPSKESFRHPSVTKPCSVTLPSPEVGSVPNPEGCQNDGESNAIAPNPTDPEPAPSPKPLIQLLAECPSLEELYKIQATHSETELEAAFKKIPNGIQRENIRGWGKFIKENPNFFIDGTA